MTTDRWITIRYTKWPDRPHYEFRGRVLGEDDHGVWSACEVGETVLKGGVEAFVRPVTLLSLVPRGDEHWSASWQPPDEPVYDLYVDINTPPAWDGDVVTMIDLDLDVERFHDGSVVLQDEDELVEHAERYGYPDDLVALTWRAANHVLERVRAPAEPFASAWRPWHERLFGGA